MRGPKSYVVYSPIKNFQELQLHQRLKVHQRRFENVAICSSSYKNNILKVFDS